MRLHLRGSTWPSFKTKGHGHRVQEHEERLRGGHGPQRPQLHLQVYASWETRTSGKHFTGLRIVISLQEVIARLSFDVRSVVRLHDYAPSNLKRVSPAHILHPLQCSPSIKCFRVGGLKLNQGAWHWLLLSETRGSLRSPPDTVKGPAILSN